MVKVISASTCAGIVVLDYSTYHARGSLTLPGRVFTSNKLYAYSAFRYRICYILTANSDQNCLQVSIVNQRNMTFLIDRKARGKPLTKSLCINSS